MHSQVLFGTTWAKLMGVDCEKMKKDPIAQKSYITALLCSLIMAIIISHFIEYTHASGSWYDGLKIGFRCWLGFTLTTMLPNHIFQPKNFSWLLAAIN